ncbi:hypothetical protein P152DRAFT_448077 [Eremomyces bilateralis CBS 781.70]|uniref:Uncharacterized protein n=1 Tax=Eremomyces bilateralis CBS 781.70 TaxID=1392243 RepID=A0A6G1G6Y3_9PEZI|nr:uncharacterized protein P152DRAFT_448077 [Eremomyces bilateralis CBS 781.70]KAF1813650.1 hypothetical protein P152DRAFT_448077 [Eremomyces bilateralis CBS 781.70]
MSSKLYELNSSRYERSATRFRDFVQPFVPHLCSDFRIPVIQYASLKLLWYKMEFVDELASSIPLFLDPLGPRTIPNIKNPVARPPTVHSTHPFPIILPIHSPQFQRSGSYPSKNPPYFLASAAHPFRMFGRYMRSPHTALHGGALCTENSGGHEHAHGAKVAQWPDKGLFRGRGRDPGSQPRRTLPIMNQSLGGLAEDWFGVLIFWNLEE